MRPLTLLIDMDDTIENCTEAWILYANRRYGESVDPDSITTWDPSVSFSHVTHDQMYALLGEGALYDEIVPLPGAVEALKALLKDGHKVLLVTSTTPEAITYKKEKVFDRWFSFLPSENVIFTQDKSHVKGDILIDDLPRNLETSSARGILFTAPHNRAYDAAAHGFLRVHDWNELLPILREMAEKE